MAGQKAEPDAKMDAAYELQGLNKALHDLCQPLTTLQCRLEMATVVGTDAGYREAVELGLGECARLMDAVESLRDLLRTAVQGSESRTV